MSKNNDPFNLDGWKLIRCGFTHDLDRKAVLRKGNDMRMYSRDRKTDQWMLDEWPVQDYIVRYGSVS